MIETFDLSGIIALLVMIGGLIGVYVKQVKDISEIRLTMERDKEETDKEIALLKIQLESRAQKDNEIVSLLNEIKTNQAVFSQKIENIMETGTAFARQKIENLEKKMNP